MCRLMEISHATEQPYNCCFIKLSVTCIFEVKASFPFFCTFMAVAIKLELCCIAYLLS